MHALFFTFISGHGGAKVIEIDQDLSKLQSKCIGRCRLYALCKHTHLVAIM